MFANILARLSQLSVNKYSETKLFRLINFFIFLSLFAVTASIISLYFEKKIDNLDKNISTININSNIYNHYISSITSKIKNTEMVLANSDAKEPNKKLLEFSGISLKYIREDVDSYIYVHFLNDNLNILELALKEAIVISSSNQDLELIKEFKKKVENLKKKIDEKKKENFNWIQKEDLIELNKIQDKYEKRYYINKILLKESKILLMQLSVNFFLEKKSENELILKNANFSIEKYSKNESRAIWLAFFLQLLVFFVTQFFEFAFEHPIKKRKGKS